MIFLRTALLAIVATSSAMSSELRGTERDLNLAADCVNDDAWNYGTNVDTGCNEQYPNCVGLDGKEVGGYASGTMCVGAAVCTNTAPFGGQDEGCTADAPVCLSDDDEHPAANVAGDKCIKPVCMQSQPYGGIDKGCSSDAPLCVDKDGKEPADWSIGFECVRCRNSDPSDSGVHVDFGCPDSTPFCIDSASTSACPFPAWAVGDTCVAEKPKEKRAYVTGVWTEDTIHILDEDLNSIASFSTGSRNPNGVATDGTIIYSGHFNPREVYAYDFEGTELFKWALDGSVSGLELVDGELARITSTENQIDFFDPMTGAQVRSIPRSSGGREGIAYDGEVLWQLASGNIIGVSPVDGSPVSIIPNAATSCLFGGTAITALSTDEILLACTNGNWFRVASLDGSVVASGNNGLNMFGLKIACPA